MTALADGVAPPALERWLQDHVADIVSPLALTKFAGGQSNPTFRVTDGAGHSLVLRRRPTGPLLPSAHAVDREYRLLAALHPLGFPVPKPYALCEDDAVIGSAFYVMALAQGTNQINGALPSFAPNQRRAMYFGMVDTLAALHGVDYEAAGLGGFGKPGNFFARQVDRWTKQYRAAQTDDLVDMEWLVGYLPRAVPQQERSTIVHGDFRIDNMMFDDAGDVSAVLDWELSTLGDPLADLSYFILQWTLPADGNAPLGGLDLAALGIPTIDEVVAHYCTLTGRDKLPDLHWLVAFNLFRLAGIVQGIKKRIAIGNASSARAGQIVQMIPLLARRAREIAEGGPLGN
jgi:aminoglycoside phosphotransferase (APT) family kinase protein